MELSKRLQAVADLLSGGLRVADIGCDHGFLSIYLVKTGKAPGCIAMDVNRGPLERAEKHIQREGLSTYIDTRLSDGARALDSAEKVEAAVMAGMGGKLMIRIIEDSREQFLRMRELVLQPQSEIAMVRAYVRQMGWQITAEDMVLEEGKFYPMMRVEAGSKERASEKQELFDCYGELLLKNRHPVLKEFLKKEEKQQKEILLKLQEKNTARSRERSRQIQKNLEKIHQGLEWFTDEV
ncbi:MAG: tRNA (adenine(22)-N(1))-methyltransferase [Lachnospiraceae bacterium]